VAAADACVVAFCTVVVVAGTVVVGGVVVGAGVGGGGGIGGCWRTSWIPVHMGRPLLLLLLSLPTKDKTVRLARTKLSLLMRRGLPYPARESTSKLLTTGLPFSTTSKTLAPGEALSSSIKCMTMSYFPG